MKGLDRRSEWGRNSKKRRRGEDKEERAQGRKGSRGVQKKVSLRTESAKID